MGSIAGWVGGRLDNVMMRFVDALYALPYMIFVILIMVFIENKTNCPVEEGPDLDFGAPPILVYFSRSCR